VLGYLSGKVLDHTTGRLLVGVGSAESGGVVGYSVMVPESGSQAGLLPGNSVELFIHTHVREDALDLFGFHSSGEKDLFLTLLEVSGIGPKSALAILSGSDAGKLIGAIIKGDKAYLGSLPGIGKKTAERIVLELGDKIRKKTDAGIYISLNPAAGATAAGAATFARAGGKAVSGNALVRDSVSALVGLGYREADALELVNRLIDESETPPSKVEDVIRSALRNLA
jgi:Holliday junction DNA helicase RuvA